MNMKTKQELMAMSIEELQKESNEYYTYVRQIDAMAEFKKRFPE
jgi:hypothetical protein